MSYENKSCDTDVVFVGSQHIIREDDGIDKLFCGPYV